MTKKDKKHKEGREGEKEREAQEYRDKWLRACAELENSRKRLEKEKEEFLRYANEDLILRLLPIVGKFDRALASVKHTRESDAVLKGIKMVQKELHTLFKDYGVEVVESLGKKFDPHLHEAIAVVETDEHPDAQGVMRRVRERMPTISFDTVYRTLSFLEEHELIRRVHTAEGRARFDGNHRPHHHFICTNCGKITDFESAELDKMALPEAASRLGTASSRQLQVFGICRDCDDGLGGKEETDG